MMRKSLESREETAFVSLLRQYENVITDLNDPDVFADETLSSDKYNVFA
jgi:hypothetical protein